MEEEQLSDLNAINAGRLKFWTVKLWRSALTSEIFPVGIPKQEAHKRCLGDMDRSENSLHFQSHKLMKIYDVSESKAL